MAERDPIHEVLKRLQNLKLSSPLRTDQNSDENKENIAGQENLKGRAEEKQEKALPHSATSSEKPLTTPKLNVIASVESEKEKSFKKQEIPEEYSSENASLIEERNPEINESVVSDLNNQTNEPLNQINSLLVDFSELENECVVDEEHSSTETKETVISHLSNATVEIPSTGSPENSLSGLDNSVNPSNLSSDEVATNETYTDSLNNLNQSTNEFSGSIIVESCDQIQQTSYSSGSDSSAIDSNNSLNETICVKREIETNPDSELVNISEIPEDFSRSKSSNPISITCSLPKELFENIIGQNSDVEDIDKSLANLVSDSSGKLSDTSLNLQECSIDSKSCKNLELDCSIKTTDTSLSLVYSSDSKSFINFESDNSAKHSDTSLNLVHSLESKSCVNLESDHSAKNTDTSLNVQECSTENESCNNLEVGNSIKTIDTSLNLQESSTENKSFENLNLDSSARTNDTFLNVLEYSAGSKSCVNFELDSSAKNTETTTLQESPTETKSCKNLELGSFTKDIDTSLNLIESSTENKSSQNLDLDSSASSTDTSLNSLVSSTESKSEENLVLDSPGKSSDTSLNSEESCINKLSELEDSSEAENNRSCTDAEEEESEKSDKSVSDSDDQITYTSADSSIVSSPPDSPDSEEGTSEETLTLKREDDTLVPSTDTDHLSDDINFEGNYCETNIDDIADTQTELKVGQVGNLKNIQVIFEEMEEMNSRLQEENSDLKLELNAAKQAKASLELEMSKKDEIILKTEAEALKKEQEIKALKEQLKEKSSVNEKDIIKNLEEALKEAKTKESQAVSDLNARINDELNYRKIMEEYEKTIAARIADFQKVKEENETVTRHLTNLESYFSDLHQKYERTKTVITGFKSNEEQLTKSCAILEDTIRKQEEKYESLKTYAQNQIEKCNIEILQYKEKNETEMNKLNAIIRRLEIKTASLETALEQKMKECIDLAALLDEVTGQTVCNIETLQCKEKNETEMNKLDATIRRLEIKTASLETALEQKIKECIDLAALLDEVTGQTV